MSEVSAAPIYSTRTLLGIFYDAEAMRPPESYWMQNFYTSEVQFDTETIELSKLSDIRKIAPLVVPTAQGVPIYSAAERVSVVKPAYLKPKDPVSASRMIRRVAGLGELGSQVPLTPLQRYNAIVADIVRQHRYAIERRWEWMAAEATIKGQVVLEGERYPRTIVDFDRDPGHEIVLTAGNRWGDSGVSILNSVETMRSICRKAKFGGPTNRLTVGADVWDVMRSDSELLELLRVDYRPSNNGLQMNLGLREGLDVEWVGRLSGTLDVYVYSDYYQDNQTGEVIEYLSPKDIVLTGNNIAGVRAFGAIQDIAANFQPLKVFPKMWPENDPSVMMIMHQSAPLMVPVNPNNTFHATVVQ